MKFLKPFFILLSILLLIPAAFCTEFEWNSGQRWSPAADFNLFSGTRSDHSSTALEAEKAHFFSEFQLKVFSEKESFFKKGMFISVLLPKTLHLSDTPVGESTLTKQSQLMGLNFGVSFLKEIKKWSRERKKFYIGIEPSLGLFKITQNYTTSSSTNQLSALSWNEKITLLLKYQQMMNKNWSWITQLDFSYNPSSAYWVTDSSGSLYSDLRSGSRIYKQNDQNEREKFHTNLTGFTVHIGIVYRPTPELQTESKQEPSLPSNDFENKESEAKELFNLPFFKITP